MRRGRMIHPSDLIDVVEAVYDLDTTDSEGWLTNVLAKFRPMFDHGMGVCVYLSEPGRPFEAVAAFGIPDGWDSAMRALMTSSAAPRLLRPRRPALTASDGVGKEVLPSNEAMVNEWHPRGVFDGVGVTANDGTGRLVTFVAPLPVVSSLSARFSARYERVAAHVAAGWRLRRSLTVEPAAVLTPAGKVVHAEGSARERSARERLRAAAVAIDRARGALRRQDGGAALNLWQVLVDGEWSLVDRFDTDGRRFLIALKNDPEVTDPRALTLRERQVLAYTAMGHSLKLIAYSLGISSSTVSANRQTAMRKLGLRTHADVVRLFAPAPTPEPSQDR